ncbi:hypothetical protein LEMLEM_LOCUS17926 [Lemmus lemmus]
MSLPSSPCSLLSHSLSLLPLPTAPTNSATFPKERIKNVCSFITPCHKYSAWSLCQSLGMHRSGRQEYGWAAFELLLGSREPGLEIAPHSTLSLSMSLPQPLDYCGPGILQSLSYPCHVGSENQEHLVSSQPSMSGPWVSSGCVYNKRILLGHIWTLFTKGVMAKETAFYVRHPSWGHKLYTSGGPSVIHGRAYTQSQGSVVGPRGASPRWT